MERRSRPPARLEELAEDARVYSLAGDGDAWHVMEDVALLDNPVAELYWYHQAQRVRFEASRADRRIAEVREWFRARGRTEWGWSVGPSATPPDLSARLVAAGAVPDPHGPSTVMVLRREPPPADAGIPVRRVASRADFDALDRVRAAAFAFGESELHALAASRQARYVAFTTSGVVAFLAHAEGRPAAAGAMEPLAGGAWMLFGGGTRPEARGRGLYCALVRARWDHAAARGTPGLVVEANDRSGPILAALGFEPVATVHRFIDRAG